MEELKPLIIIDTREQDPLPISAYPTATGTLNTGDYSFAGGEHWLSIERKSIADPVQSLTTERERFIRELERLRGYRFSRLLIIGCRGDIEQGHYRSRATPKAMLHSLWSIEAKYCPVVFAPDPAAGAELVERWCFWTARAFVEIANQITKPKPIT